MNVLDPCKNEDDNGPFYFYCFNFDFEYYLVSTLVFGLVGFNKKVQDNLDFSF